ncbi:hypothetical protein [Caulobacter hibisci]|nr:hypothetical protein [Caulobacter hibisci]
MSPRRRPTAQLLTPAGWVSLALAVGLAGAGVLTVIAVLRAP